ncbi:MAG TPA: DUF4190 domain-containing protein [Acidimicrobiia bacterium]|nr:DUF4190 domain-containing protein [Acidimicrobiia bacterium]
MSVACRQCGSEMTAEAKFCPACGTAVAGAAEPGASNGAGHGLPDGAPGYAAPIRPPPPPPAPPPTQGYPAPYGYGAPPTSTNGMAVAAMVLGILWLYWLGSILALIFGYVAKSRIDRSGGRQGGRGMAIAGIVLGWVGVGLLVVVIIAAIVAASND